MKERTKQILSRLLTVNTFLTSKELSKEFYVSERTLRNELVIINNYLSKHNYPLISTTRGKGLKLNLPDEDRETILRKVNDERETDYFRPNERFLILLLEIADTTNKTMLFKMEEKLQISKSTLDEDMRKLRQFLKKFSISVVSLPKQGIVMQGDERSIRSMLYDVINNTVDINNLMGYRDEESVAILSEQLILDYLDSNILKIIEKQFDAEFEESKVKINHVYRNQIILFLAIWIKRIQEGNTLSKLDKVKTSLKDGPIRNLVDSIYLKFDLYPSLNEIKYITFIIESFNPKDMNNSFDWITAQLLAIQLIDHVEKITRIPFSQREQDLYEGLYKHITGLLSRAKNDLQVFNPLKEKIKDSYPEIYQAVTCFKNQIEEYTKSELSEDEIGFLTIYFSTSASQINQVVQYVYNAVVLCNHGVSTGKLLAENLKEHFNVDIVAVLSSNELAFIDKLDVDLVFTTVSINYPKKPVLLLNPILRDSDMKEIKTFLLKNREKRRITSNKLDATKLMQDILKFIVENGGNVTQECYQKVAEIFKNHHLEINTREIQPMLQDILSDSYILLKQECKDWKDTITKAAKILVTKGDIEERYISAMIKSIEEYGPYIVVGKHLALAHARPEDGVNKLSMSVMTLKEPVYFGHPDNDPVKIVFCLAAVDSYSHLNIMKNLIALINDQEKVNQLITAQDVNTFNQLLFEDEVMK